jgi:hypothetical protein
MNRKGEAVFVLAEGNDYNVGLYARTYNPSLGWSSPSPAIASSNGMSTIATALDEQGNVTIAWQQNLASGKANLMAIHGSVTGSWSDIAVLETDNVASYYTYEFAYPKLAVDGNGNVLLVWRKDQSTSSITTYGAYGSRFSAGAWSPQFRLGQKTGLNVVDVSLSVSDQGFGAAAFTYMAEDSTSDPDAYNTMVAFYR